jgi:hypothetical protein
LSRDKFVGDKLSRDKLSRDKLLRDKLPLSQNINVKWLYALSNWYVVYVPIKLERIDWSVVSVSAPAKSLELMHVPLIELEINFDCAVNNEKCVDFCGFNLDQ